MGAAGHLNDIKTRFASLPLSERPFFIRDTDWDIFIAYAGAGETVPDIARKYRWPVERVRATLHQVDRLLALPRPSHREWQQITPNSPIEDLQLSVRTLNQLRDLECVIVEQVLRLDFNRHPIGRASRMEVLDALRRSGFAFAVESASSRSADLQKVSEQLHDLRERIDEQVRKWQNRVNYLEARLRRLSGAGN